MPKKQSSLLHRPGQTLPDLRQQGLLALEAGRYEQAIAAWTGLARHDPAVAVALAEAHLRRARTLPAGDAQVREIQQALRLAPDQQRYQYALGLALHRAGNLSGAIERYRAVLDSDPSSPGVALVLALALLEQKPDNNSTELSGSPEIAALLSPVRALLHGDNVGLDDTPAGQLWQGLALLRQRDPTARSVLQSTSPLAPRAAAVRRYYADVAAALAGDVDTALDSWLRLYQESSRSYAPIQPWLLQNLFAALYSRLNAQLTSGDRAGAVRTAERTLKLPLTNAALGALVVEALDHGARMAADAGDWARATRLWQGAREVVGRVAGLGSPRPLHHNLAIACEMQERWIDAAEAWRAMLRTKPRQGSSAASDAQPDSASASLPPLTSAQWSWVRRRVIECYKRAGQPGEAVTVFRQALKAEPDDLDLRLQLADALLANDQEQAALNELQRVLERDAENVEARLRMAAIHSARGDLYAAEGALRGIMAHQPDHAQMRQQLARLLLQRGEQHLFWGQTEAAQAALAEGQELAPDDFNFPLNLARLAFGQRQLERARQLLERVLQLGADTPDAYLHAIDCWAQAGDVDEARAVLARAEAALKLEPPFYIAAGGLLLEQDQPPAMVHPFAPSPKPRPANPQLVEFATQLLDRAIALEPDEPRIRLEIAAELMRVQPELALRYAEDATQLLPDDPQALLLLGLIQALNGQKRAARKTLTRAGLLARRAGDHDLDAQISSLRSQINSPFFRLSLQMGPLLGDIDDVEDEFFM